ncbi:HSP90 family protein [Listeria monocytogenes]|uniref:Chaperone protein HtpG n=1 Tax=Listeria monocytogenes TaxID=1639 RepID=A0A3T2HZM5_LISMN|nr:HSP90 family protein [Listeria monocytogenes]EAA0164849.1 HSP90 family protein [Listeria monocytogenes serotype 1/2a]EAD3235106.1 HSP90 family protein [Listeria monocytogenes CFSAN002202]EAF4501406.1 HSP90 family protein [Listeria monocytogenes serotype 4b]EAG9423161.1 HSP90 family protein [Listeria monocytogenes CFSAN002184]EAG9458726.1 HSP90 family protein [Listeria monocytogenes CFSAN002208]ECT1641492.1 HSP90 family protein [Listeria monocytogenes CFSAN002191]EHC6203084.1 HSP90 family 
MENYSHRFQVNLAGMIDILSNHLYDEKDVYIRELLQNATDAIRARKKIDSTLEGKIHASLTGDNNEKTLIVEDNGIGLTEDEVHAFLATIANSSKGEKNFDGESSNDFIGRFGIGLLSCFIVSDEIVMISTSQKDGGTTEWRGKADGTYSVRKIETDTREPGTQVYLRLRAGLEDHPECEDVEYLINTLKKYGSSLESNIIVEMNGLEEEINSWTKQFSDKETLSTLSREQIIQYGEYILGTHFQDYFLIENESGRTFGIAYMIPHAVQMNAIRKNTVFLNKMFVTSEANNILPDWSFFAKCVIWTDELQPVASREAFYKNERLTSVASELGVALKKGIETLPEEALMKLLATHYLGFKALASEDAPFLKLIYPYLPVRTLNGEEKLGDIIAKNDVIYYTYSVDDFRQIKDIARSSGMTLINGGYSYDSPILAQLSYFVEGTEFILIEPEEMTDKLRPMTGDEEQAYQPILTEMNSMMVEFDTDVLIKHFEPKDLPIIFIHSTATQELRELERAVEETSSVFSDILESIQKEQEPAPLAHLYLNLDNELIKRLFTSEKTVKELSVIVNVLYIQALLLGHYPLKRKEMVLMNQNMLRILEML